MHQPMQTRKHLGRSQAYRGGAAKPMEQQKPLLVTQLNPSCVQSARCGVSWPKLFAKRLHVIFIESSGRTVVNQT